MAQDEQDIRSVIERWAIARDSGAWDQLRSTWHEDGRMRATWFRGAADDFVAASRRGFENGVLVHHFLGGTLVDVSGDRAVAQTKMTISQRLDLAGVEIDVTCVGRFYDFFERRDVGWRLVLRDPIYEKDRIDPVAPDTAPLIDQTALNRLPYGCRHLLYCQQRAGLDIYTDVPGVSGPEVERLYSSGRLWLEGQQIDR